MAPAPPTVAAPTVMRHSSIDETEDKETIETMGNDDLHTQGDDKGDHQQIDPQLLRLIEHADELIALIMEAQATVNRTTNLDERMRTWSTESAALKRDLLSNTNFINSQQSKIENFNFGR